MSRFWHRKGREGEDAAATAPEMTAQDVEELLDRHHNRASIIEAGRIVVEPGQVLRNITEAMERVDLDINTEISIEDDVASFNEIHAMIESMALGPTLAVHVANTALQLMTPRYPAELVRQPLPPQYDVRELLPAMAFDDAEHETAKRIFNRRLASDTDLTERDVRGDLDLLDTQGQMQVFMALFVMFGHKVGAIKNVTGAE